MNVSEIKQWHLLYAPNDKDGVCMARFHFYRREKTSLPAGRKRQGCYCEKFTSARSKSALWMCKRYRIFSRRRRINGLRYKLSVIVQILLRTEKYLAIAKIDSSAVTSSTSISFLGVIFGSLQPKWHFVLQWAGSIKIHSCK